MYPGSFSYWGSLNYNIAEFILNNKNEITSYINDEVNSVDHYFQIFNKTPDLKKNVMNYARLCALRDYLSNHLPLSPEDLMTEIDEELVQLLGV